MGCWSFLSQLFASKRAAADPARPAAGAVDLNDVAPTVGQQPPGQKASSKAAPPDFSPQLKKGLVVPDETKGPYDLSSYHKNVQGAGRGFCEDFAGYQKWRDSNVEKLKEYDRLEAVDWDHPNAPDPDFALVFCGLAGLKLNMAKMRPRIFDAQKEMVRVYRAALESAMAKPGAAAAFEKIKQLEERRKKEHQPGGKELDIVGLFKGALGAIGELWAYGLEVREASGERDAALSWGIKKALRIWYKLVNKYKGDVSCVTDCARISLEFKTAEGLLAAAKKLLERASTFKNRVANPTDEGYCDLMFTLPMSNGHICEVQLHLVEMMEAKKSGAGHRKYKLCRRILRNPVVSEDTYCREIKDGKPHGEGERNAAGEREGFGVMVFADGNVYEGQWRAGRMEGEGTDDFADGSRYEGQYVADRREGVGTFHFATGSRYEGQFVADKREGKGTFHYADGNRYEGEYVADKKEGKGTFHYADGEVEVDCWKDDARVGEGAKWSADRATAWRVSDGRAGERISLEEAARIAERVGLPVPGASA